MVKITSILLLTFIMDSAGASTPKAPRLFFSYSWLYDSVVCEKTPVNSLWVREIESRTESFSKVWSDRGAVLFDVLFDRTGIGFSRKEMTATFSVCPKKPSYSTPLILSMNRYLDSYMNPKPSYGEDDFVDLVFHELLHSWVVENLKSSSLIAKYWNEIPSVRNHMHLMAIQKYTYEKLKRDDLVEMLEATYARIGGSYARAWEIVQIEGTEVFLEEFPMRPGYEEGVSILEETPSR